MLKGRLGIWNSLDFAITQSGFINQMFRGEDRLWNHLVGNLP